MINREILDKIAEMNFWHKEQDTGIKRPELKEVLELVDIKHIATAVIGIRSAGKTFLSKQILKEKINNGSKKEHTLYINFEDPILEPHLNVEGLESIYKSYRYFINKDDFAYMVFDEIHNVPKWEKWIRMLLEKREHVKILITGSSSKLSKSDLANVLTGRVVSYTLFPLSFTSFLEFKNYKPKDYETLESLSGLFTEYLQYGGFPSVVVAEKQTQKTALLKDLFNDILVKDIILKHKLRETDVKKLALLILNNFSSYVSIGKLCNLMENIIKVKMSPTSVNTYLHYFEDAFLFFLIPKFSYKMKDVMQYPRKIYCIDTGIINTMILKFSENMGRLYENLAAIELVKRHGKENVFYWKNGNEREVDFVIKEGLRVKELIQICWNMENPETKKREIRGLLGAMEEFKLKTSLIITEDFEGEETINSKKITYIPLWKWLLEAVNFSE